MPATANVRWYPSLHVLRGIAALSVACLHYARLWPESYGLLGFPWFGYAGTYLFFVMSGFMMVHISEGKVGLDAAWRFVLARLNRTVPPYWAALCLAMVVYALVPTAGVKMGVPAPYDGATIGWSMLAVDQRLLPVSWTLGYEWRFYVTFAVVCIACRVPPWMLAVGWLGVLVWYQSASPHGYTSSNIFGLLVGTWLGEGVRRYGTGGPWVGLGGGALLALGLYVKHWPTPNAEWVYPVLLAPLVLAAIRCDTERAPQYPAPLLWLGDYSYALYLVHYPCIWLGMWWAGRV